MESSRADVASVVASMVSVWVFKGPVEISVDTVSEKLEKIEVLSTSTEIVALEAGRQGPAWLTSNKTNKAVILKRTK